MPVMILLRNLEGKTCFITTFSCCNNDGIMISYPTLRDITAVFQQPSWCVSDTMFTELCWFSRWYFTFLPLSPSVPPYCRSCSLSCCLSSFQPSCSLTPAPPPCSTSHRPTTSQSPSSPRLASTGPPAWCAAHRITPTPWRWGWWCWIVNGMIGAFCYNFSALKLKIGQNIEIQKYNIFWNYTQPYNPPELSFFSISWLQRKNIPLNEMYMLPTVVI